MKKLLGWILIILGGLFCFEGILVIPSIFAASDIPLGDKASLLLIFTVLAAIGALLFRAGFRMKPAGRSASSRPSAPEGNSAGKTPDSPTNSEPEALPDPVTEPAENTPSGPTPSSQRKEAEDKAADAARAEMKAMYREFLSGEGRLPDGFSERYNIVLTDSCIFRGTPFDAHIRKIASDADAIHDRSGISDWLFMDETAGPDAAAQILAWADRHREMKKRLWEKCSIGSTTIFPPVSLYCAQKVMVVMDTDAPFRSFPPEDVEKCKEAGISFCTHLTEETFFDLTEQKSKWLSCTTYPNYHDETYADWFFQ